jgi:hypothetical protein
MLYGFHFWARTPPDEFTSHQEAFLFPLSLTYYFYYFTKLIICKNLKNLRIIN